MNKRRFLIKEIPKQERPREKLIKYGPEKLCNSELLAILLRSGRKGESSLNLAKKILKKVTSQKLISSEISDLTCYSGIGKAKACEIIACFELGKRFLKGKKTTMLISPREIWDEMKDVRNKKKEYFVIFYLDIQNQVIRRKIISIGTLDASIVHPREVFELAVKKHAAQIIIAHNHPSGRITPSKEDVQVTARLVKAGEILGIKVIDHVIVTEKRYVSLKEKGMM